MKRNVIYDNWRPGPEVPRAHHFDVAFCESPTCGLHMLAMREDNTVICEVVMSADQTLKMITLCRDFLYDKAVKRE